MLSIVLQRAATAALTAIGTWLVLSLLGGGTDGADGVRHVRGTGQRPESGAAAGARPLFAIHRLRESNTTST
jgi:hypothetical protein